MSKEAFLKHVKERNPNIDINKLFSIFESVIKEVQLIPGQSLVLPLDCDMNKAILAKTLSKYIEE
jgi:hypothetical protein